MGLLYNYFTHVESQSVGTDIFVICERVCFR